jgi:hypothetical protein
LPPENRAGLLRAGAKKRLVHALRRHRDCGSPGQ